MMQSDANSFEGYVTVLINDFRFSYIIFGINLQSRDEENIVDLYYEDFISK